MARAPFGLAGFIDCDHEEGEWIDVPYPRVRLSPD